MRSYCSALIIRLVLGGIVLTGMPTDLRAQGGTTADGAQEAQTMSLDVKETDIRDVIRMISRGYNLNIILDNDITGVVTLHLSDVPIMEGLRSLARSRGLQVTKEGSVYRIRKAVTEERSSIRFHRGRLTVDVENVEVNEFIKEVASRTAVSIVPDSKISGKVSGKLYEVPVDDGLIAILEGSGFTVTKRRNIYRVSSGDQAERPGQSSSQQARRTPSRRSKGFYVDYSNGHLTMEVSNANLDDVIKEIADQSDIEIVTYGNLAGEVNAVLNNIPLAEAFTLLLGGTKFTFVQKGNVILIGDRNTATPSGQALSKSELIHLRHIKADEVPKILPKNVPAANVKVVKEQNALLVSGTSEDIVKTREFLETVDIATPQVVIDAVVVEYSRELDRDFGLEWGNAASTESAVSANNSNNEYSFPSIKYNRRGVGARKFLQNDLGLPQSWKFITQLPPTFYFSLRLLESEGKAKVLAQPSITVLNGNKASINVGQTQYFRIVGGTSENPTYRFQPISFGIQLNITPWISQSGQITAEISPEISNAMGTNEDGYPNVFKRSVSTTVRLNHGQTLILGGLLRSDEQMSHKKVPLLADIPILGYIFKTTLKKNTKTNLVIYITPHLLSVGDTVDLPNALKQFEKDERQGIGLRQKIFSDFADEVIEEDVERKKRNGVSAPDHQAPASPAAEVSPPRRNPPAAPSTTVPDSAVVPRPAPQRQPVRSEQKTPPRQQPGTQSPPPSRVPATSPPPSDADTTGRTPSP